MITWLKLKVPTMTERDTHSKMWNTNQNIKVIYKNHFAIKDIISANDAIADLNHLHHAFAKLTKNLCC